MSLELLLAETNATLKELIAVTRESMAQRQGVIEKIESGTVAAGTAAASPARTRGRPSKVETEAAAAAAAAAAADPTPTAAAPAPVAEISIDQVRSEFADYLKATDDPVERDKRKAFIAEIGDHFGARPTEVAAESRPQLLFYLARKVAGLPVDFNADYDFSGDPKQGGTPPAPQPSDDDGI